MKFLNQTRFSQSRLADDQHQLTLALPSPLPPSHQRDDFFVAAHKRREMTLPGPASPAARPHEPEQRHWFSQTFEFMAPALLGNKQANDLALYLRGHNNSARLC